MSTSRLFRRKVELAVTKPTGGTAASGDEETSTLHLRNVDLNFTVERTITSEPSTLHCEIFNLSIDSRNHLQKAKEVDVELSVAYGDNDLYNIFKGNLRSAIHSRNGATLVTTLEAGDGERSQAVWFSKTYGKDTSYSTVIKELVAAMGIGEGNVDEVDNLSDETGKGLGTSFKNGIAVHGHAADELGQLLSGKGVEWSVQNNELQILGIGKAVQRGTLVANLTTETGLIGVPTITNKKIMTAECLITPGIYPGALVDITSEFVEGRFKVRKAVYSGSTTGGDWHIKIEGRPEK